MDQAVSEDQWRIERKQQVGVQSADVGGNCRVLGSGCWGLNFWMAGQENIICGNLSEAFPYIFLRNNTDQSTPSWMTSDSPPLPTTQSHCNKIRLQLSRLPAVLRNLLLDGCVYSSAKWYHSESEILVVLKSVVSLTLTLRKLNFTLQTTLNLVSSPLVWDHMSSNCRQVIVFSFSIIKQR